MKFLACCELGFRTKDHFGCFPAKISDIFLKEVGKRMINTELSLSLLKDM